MPTLQEGGLQFNFYPSHEVLKYDASRHFCEVMRLRHRKGADFTAKKAGAHPQILWIIEVKDFRTLTREPRQNNLRNLAQTVFEKVIDTRDGLADAAIHALDAGEKKFARRAAIAGRIRVVLHLEPHTGPHSRLFPGNFSGGVLQKLRQLLRDVDPQPFVLNLASTPRANVPWSVA